MVGLSSQRASAEYLIEKYDASVRGAATVLGLNRSTMTYKPHPSKDEALEKRIKELAAKHRRFGLPRLHYLLWRDGFVVNKKRTERIYNKLGLQLKKRRRAKQMAVTRVPHNKAEKPNDI